MRPTTPRFFVTALGLLLCVLSLSCVVGDIEDTPTLALVSNSGQWSCNADMTTCTKERDDKGAQPQDRCKGQTVGPDRNQGPVLCHASPE